MKYICCHLLFSFSLINAFSQIPDEIKSIFVNGNYANQIAEVKNPVMKTVVKKYPRLISVLVWKENDIGAGFRLEW